MQNDRLHDLILLSFLTLNQVNPNPKSAILDFYAS